MPTSTIIQAAFLDLQALADYSSCSVRWLRARLTDKQAPLPCYRIGGKVLVKVDEFDRWMAGHRVSPQPDDLDQIVDDVISRLAPKKSV
jgi:hypothetical protein